jgi:ribosome production factor 1
MFQTLFPPLPDFEGRQVVTLHNQRDFLFFRRHRWDALLLKQAEVLTSLRYAFRSEEKVALQEIGPRFTLKLRSLRKNIPAVKEYTAAPKPLELGGISKNQENASEASSEVPKQPIVPCEDEFLWQWKVKICFRP